MTPRQILFSAFPLGLLLLAAVFAIGCQPEDEVQATPPPDRSTEIPMTTVSERARAVFLDGLYDLAVGNEQAAQAHFREAVSIDPDFTYAYVHLADVAASPETFEQSVAKAMATSADKSEGERLLAQIRQTYISNDAELRLTLAADLTEAYPESAYAWVERGRVYRSRGEVEQARAAWVRASELSPNLVASSVLLAHSYTLETPHDVNRAITYAQRAVNLQPEEAALRVWLGDANRGNGDLEGARLNYEEATQLDAAYAPAHVKLGHVHSFLGNYDEARTSYDTGVEQARDVEKAQLANYRAFVFLYEGTPKAAYNELGDIVSMIQDMNLPASETTGVTFFTLTNQFLVAAHNDMMQGAEAALAQRRQLSIDVIERTADPTMKVNIENDRLYWDGYLAAASGNTDKAREIAAAYHDRVKDQTAPQRFQREHHLLGVAALMDGDVETAVEHLSQAHLNNIGIRYQLAQAHERAGDIDAAMRLYDEVARYNFNSVEFALVRDDATRKRQS
ncbi:MAG: tetratricopeptide repeat protein [Bacteroidetes bacterium]|jgi:tetratricopeptide (TPR) repeat protein|nr:tetratricopeptide repeat protein [Bacteroidota bacterium]